MITLLHGGQTGADRGAHEAAIANGWHVTGYMPRDQRDERGLIPEDVARMLMPHDKIGYGARTEANVAMANAALIVVPNAADRRATPGTSKTLDLTAARRLPLLVVDPAIDSAFVASWIWADLLVCGAQLSLFEDDIRGRRGSTRLLVAGPRESKWAGAQAHVAGLLRRVAISLAEIARTHKALPTR